MKGNKESTLPCLISLVFAVSLMHCVFLTSSSVGSTTPSIMHKKCFQLIPCYIQYALQVSVSACQIAQACNARSLKLVHFGTTGILTFVFWCSVKDYLQRKLNLCRVDQLLSYIKVNLEYKFLFSHFACMHIFSCLDNLFITSQIIFWMLFHRNYFWQQHQFSQPFTASKSTIVIQLLSG